MPEQQERLWEFIKRHSGPEDRCGNPDWTIWFTGLGLEGRQYRQCKNCVHHYQIVPPVRRVIRVYRKKPARRARSPARDWAAEYFT